MPPQTAQTQWKRSHTILFLLFVTVLSYLTYMHRYTYPQAPYWDENYYITDAQREMNHMFYMQIHPPLGKLMIAWGEEIVQGLSHFTLPGRNQSVPLIYANPRTDQFLDTEHADEFPKTFTFAGYRLFPVLLSWLGAPLLFLVFLLITENALFAGFLSFLYIFDNALLVHNRGAMLDGPMMFFLILNILAFLLTLKYRDRERWKFLLASAFFGMSFALGLTTKFQNLIMILLVPFILWKLWPAKGMPSKAECRRIVDFCWSSFLAFLIFFVGVWQIHFSHMITINPKLNNNGYYQASESYKTIIAEGKQGSLLSFPVMLRDSLKYVGEYNKGIPKLDLCKSDENGSPFFLWPIGATSINYRWETPDGKAFQYLYLVANPAVWFAGLAAVIFSVVYLLAPVFYPQQKERSSRENRYLMLAFAALYFAYMITMARLDRVLFLYSYFPPLLFSFVLLALVVMELRSLGKWKIVEQQKVIGLGVLCVLIFGFHQFYRPLTYYEPLTDEQLASRELLPIWQLHCVNCENIGPLVRHRCQQ